MSSELHSHRLEILPSTVNSYNDFHVLSFSFLHFLPSRLGNFFSGATAHIGPRPSVLRFLDPTQLDTHTPTLGRTPLYEWSAQRREIFLNNTKQTQKTNIYALSGIRTRDPSIQAAVDLRLRLHGHRYRPTLSLLLWNKLWSFALVVITFYALKLSTQLRQRKPNLSRRAPLSGLTDKIFREGIEKNM